MSYHRACCCSTTSMYVASVIHSGATGWKFTHAGSLLASYADTTQLKRWVAVTPNGNVVLVGPVSTGGPGTGGNPYNLFVLNSDLEFQWGLNVGFIQDIEIDADGSMYTSGYPVTRFDSTGNIVWTQTDISLGLSYGIDIDADYVYTTGYTYEFAPSIAKLRKSDGSVYWSKSDHAVPSTSATYQAVRAGAGGALIHGEDELVVKRNATTGAIEATYQMDTVLAGRVVRALDVDASGNVYASGFTTPYWAGTDGTDRNVWKLDTDLALLDSINAQGTSVESVQVDDSDGSVWTASASAPDGSVRKWSSDLLQLQAFMAPLDFAVATYGYRNIPT